MNVTFNNIMDITFDDISIKDEPIEEMVIENEPEEPSEEIVIKDEPLDGMDDQTYEKLLVSQKIENPCVKKGDKDEENGDTFKGKICSESRGQEIKEEKQLKKYDRNTTKENQLSGTFTAQSFQPIISTSDCQQNLLVSTSPVAKVGSKNKKCDKRKLSLNTGRAHTNSKGVFVDAKQFKYFACNCRLNCYERLSLEEREDIFKRYWSVGNWQAQSIFIVNNIKLCPVTRRTTNVPNNRKWNRKMYLNGKRVCRKTFLSTLGIKSGRLNYALNRKNKDGRISPDRRGGKPVNKTPESTIVRINDFFNKLPKYKCQHPNCEKEYFHPELTIKKLYNLFMEEVKASGDIISVSYKVFSNCFHSYDVPIYLRRKDTRQLYDHQNTQTEVTTPSSSSQLVKIHRHKMRPQKTSFDTEYIAKETEAEKDSEPSGTDPFDASKCQDVNDCLESYDGDILLPKEHQDGGDCVECVNNCDGGTLSHPKCQNLEISKESLMRESPDSNFDLNSSSVEETQPNSNSNHVITENDVKESSKNGINTDENTTEESMQNEAFTTQSFQPIITSILDYEQNLLVSTSSVTEKVGSKTKKSDRKLYLNTGRAHINSKGVSVNAKQFKYFECNCRFNCFQKLSLEEREDIFKRYWAVGNWQAQSIFIVDNIKLCPVTRRTTNVSNNRKWSRKMYLNGKRVCKETFLSTLGISSGRLNYALNRKNKDGRISPDRRGGNTFNKTPPESTTIIVRINDFLNKLPKYKSQHSNNEKEYFHPELTIKKLYNLFREEVKASGDIISVSYKVFSNCFHSYDVKIYLPRKDRRQLCDRQNTQTEAATPNRQLGKIPGHEMHLQKTSFDVVKTTEAKKDKNLLRESCDSNFDRNSSSVEEAQTNSNSNHVITENDVKESSKNVINTDGNTTEENIQNGAFTTQSFQPIVPSIPDCEQNLLVCTFPVTEEVGSKSRKSDRRKLSLNTGRAYTNSKGVSVNAKKFKYFECNCRLNCYEKLSLEEREDIFRRYWALGNFQAQSIFIVDNIKLLPVTRRTTNVRNSRNWHRKMYLNGKNVCKETFLSTLGISSGRLNCALNRKNKDGRISPDRRGGKPVDKTPESTIVRINDFLNKLPKYKSQHSNSENEYFHSELTIKKLYDLFMEEVKACGDIISVSYKVFSNCFHSYDVKIYLPKKDRRQLCDRENTQTEAKTPNRQLVQIPRHEMHLQKTSFDMVKTTEAKKDKNLLRESCDSNFDLNSSSVEEAQTHSNSNHVITENDVKESSKNVIKSDGNTTEENIQNGAFTTQSFQPIVPSIPDCEQNLLVSTFPVAEEVGSKSRKCDRRKLSLNTGKAYTNSKGVSVNAKKFKYFECDCRLNCYEKLSLEEREDIFRRFWALGNWQAQSIFIVDNIKLLPVARRTTNAPNSRNWHRKMYLNGKNVCKETFLNTLGISSGRLNYALNRKNKDGRISPDRRGGKPVNKTPESTIVRINDFLNKLPKYKSQHSNSENEYFQPELTIKKLYDLFMEEVKASGDIINVSYKIFSNCFHSFDVPIFLLKNDTCQFCDRQNTQTETATPSGEFVQIRRHEMRLQNTAFAREYIAKMTEKAKKDSNMLCFSFDLERTQPIPHLNTSAVFFKRQLWLLNLGINTRHNHQPYICLWNESEGKRGANEVCSCIFEFLRTQSLASVKNIVTFTDGCCGQNRNSTIISFIVFTCLYFGFETWEHSYLESGHVYFPNDSDFALLDKGKKKINIYTQTQWIKYITKCKSRNPFKVLEMKGKILDFKSFRNSLTFRPQDTDSGPVSWREVKWFRISLNDKTIHYKTSLDPDAPQKNIDFNPTNDLNFTKDIPKKCPEIKISHEKYNDLQSVLAYVPPVYHDFFKDLPHEDLNSKKTVIEPYPSGLDEEEETSD